MTTLETKLELCVKLQDEVKKANQNILMKQGQLGDLLQDIAVTEFGYPKDSKEYSLPDLLLKAYKKTSLV